MFGYIALTIRAAYWVGTPVFVIVRAVDVFKRLDGDTDLDFVFTINDLWQAAILAIGQPAIWIYGVEPRIFTFFRLNFLDAGVRAWVGVAVWVIAGWLLAGFVRTLDEMHDQDREDARKSALWQKRPKE